MKRPYPLGAIAVLGLAFGISATASLAQSSNGDGDYQIGPPYKLDTDLTDGRPVTAALNLASYEVVDFPLPWGKCIQVSHGFLLLI